MFKLSEKKSDTKELRAVVVETLGEVMKQSPKVIAMDADLSAASGWNKFEKDFPNQFYNMGVSEANMVGVAAGLSSVGLVPFIHTFGPFATRRVFDQLYLSGGYSGNTINIYGSDPGFAVGANGGTHTTWEDVALVKMIPNSVICDAADDVQMSWIINDFSTRTGINYVRGNRKNVKQLYQEGSTFEIGKGNVVKEGNDVLIIAAGQLVSDTLEVANELEENGINCEVIDMFTIKPLDTKLIEEKIKDKKIVVTVENHSVVNGLGSSVSDFVSSLGVATPVYKIGVNEAYGQVGSPKFLQKEYGLDKESIKNKILDWY